jgi:TonB-dependent receptor
VPYQSKGTTHQLNTRHRLISLAVAGACAAFIAPAFAQQTETGAQAGVATPTDPAAITPNSSAGQSGNTVEAANTVHVTGIRAAMQSTLNLKRNSDGIVDGIVADDIGKFPDTNLAESLQRISGVSIDRNRGEGSQVTVRGVGPDLNMVLLNGRQMPTANLGDQAGRAFDFSNLASEAISQIQVYKSARADTPPGGIGATINVMTGRPLDLGNQASVGIKGVYDKSNNNLPENVKLGKSLTPEVSGLYSKVWHDGVFGISVTGSYQKRDLGVNQAAITNGWLGPFQGNTVSDTPGPIPVSGVGVTNAPKPTDIYSTPQNMSYFVRGSQRERTNGQITFQFRPVKELTTTLDYTYAQNKIHTKYNELSIWFNHPINAQQSTWTNGPNASPLYYQENVPNQDIDMNGGDFATKSNLESFGFNTQWKASPDLRFSFDAHHSVAKSGADSPFGSNNDLGTASFSRNVSAVDFTHEMPIMIIGGADYNRAPSQVIGSWFQDGENEMRINQVQAGGSWKLLESSNLNFGGSYTKVNNHSIFQQVQRDTWSGTSSNPGVDYNQALWTPAAIAPYFSKVGGSNDPRMYNQFMLFNFADVRDNAIKVTGDQAGYTPSLSNPSFDRTTVEKTKALFMQFNTEWDFAMPMHTGVGFRYEKTDVASTGLSKTPTRVDWISQNELPLVFGSQIHQTQYGSYNNFLPTVDWDMDVRSDLKLRASYGVSIGRPRYDQIQGGTTYNTTATVNGTTASSGNPALTPVKSKNLDLSAEWYYSKQSMVSLGLFHKNLDGYAGQTVINDPSTTATTPVGGKYWNAAIASGCVATDTNCMRDYILGNFNGQPGVTRTGVSPTTGHLTGTISGIAGDPALIYQTTTYINEDKATLKGAEVNWQHMFSNGLGFQANYTYVKSDLTYDNMGLGNQFALIGQANSANLVGIYEDQHWSTRLAYNWRGEFLANVADNGRPNPAYVEPYGQVDLSVGYNVNTNLSLTLEAINLTDKHQRTHGRTDQQVLTVTTGGPRYMVGARYKF